MSYCKYSLFTNKVKLFRLIFVLDCSKPKYNYMHVTLFIGFIVWGAKLKTEDIGYRACRGCRRNAPFQVLRDLNNLLLTGMRTVLCESFDCFTSVFLNVNSFPSMLS